MHNRTHDTSENNALSNRGQELESNPEQFESEKKPLPEKVTEYVQKVRDELKEYEENKKFYERMRKKGIVFQLIDLLEEHEYPKEWLRLIIAQELGDYISTSYIEKILAGKYADEEKNVKKQSTSQTEEIPQNDDKIPIEVSSTGESIVISDECDSDNTNHYLYKAQDINTEVTTVETNIEQQVEQEAGDIVTVLKARVRDLQTKCSRFEELANEGLIWKEKYIRLQKELRNSGPNTISVFPFMIFIPLDFEYNP